MLAAVHPASMDPVMAAPVVALSRRSSESTSVPSVAHTLDDHLNAQWDQTYLRINYIVANLGGPSSCPELDEVEDEDEGTAMSNRSDQELHRQKKPHLRHSSDMQDAQQQASPRRAKHLERAIDRVVQGRSTDEFLETTITRVVEEQASGTQGQAIREHVGGNNDREEGEEGDRPPLDEPVLKSSMWPYLGREQARAKLSQVKAWRDEAIKLDDSADCGCPYATLLVRLSIKYPAPPEMASWDGGSGRSLNPSDEHRAIADLHEMARTIHIPLQSSMVDESFPPPRVCIACSRPYTIREPPPRNDNNIIPIAHLKDKKEYRIGLPAEILPVLKASLSPTGPTGSIGRTGPGKIAGKLKKILSEPIRKRKEKKGMVLSKKDSGGKDGDNNNSSNNDDDVDSGSSAPDSAKAGSSEVPTSPGSGEPKTKTLIMGVPEYLTLMSCINKSGIAVEIDTDLPNTTAMWHADSSSSGSSSSNNKNNSSAVVVGGRSPPGPRPPGGYPNSQHYSSSSSSAAAASQGNLLKRIAARDAKARAARLERARKLLHKSHHQQPPLSPPSDKDKAGPSNNPRDSVRGGGGG